MVSNVALRQNHSVTHPARHPALPEREAAVVGRGLPRLEHGYATHLQMPAQGGHQHGVDGATTANRDSCLPFPVDRNERPFPKPFATGQRPASPAGDATPGPLSELVDSLGDVAHLVE